MSRATADATVRIDPPSRQVILDNAATTDVVIEDVTDLYGYEFQITFDPALVEVVDACFDPAYCPSGVQIQPGGFLSPDWIIENIADNENGTIAFALSQKDPSPPQSGTGVLATITWRGNAVGTGSIHFEYLLLSGPAGAPIPSSGQDGEILVCADADEDGHYGPPCGDDCDDSDPDAHPGATEIVADGIDQNCDGFELCYLDGDDDGYRPDATSTIQSADLDCGDTGEAGASEPTGDCDDGDSAINPGATELVADGVDQNCDGSELCYVDADDDGYRPDATSTTSSGDLDCIDSGEAGASELTDDCDDTDPAVNPGSDEVCNGIDDDCDTLVDDDDPDCTGQPTWYADSDEDGFGDPDDSLTQCEKPDGCVADNTDCDDTDPTVNPDATELCDGLDNDCDGQTDEGFPDTDGDGDADCVDDDDDGDGTNDAEDCAPLDDTRWQELPGFIDDDDDDFGTGSQLPVCSGATLPDGYAGNGEDCDDTDPTVNPDATELCDGVDNDCDGQTDEGFPDTDGDGTADCLDSDDDDDGTDDAEDCAPLDDTRWQELPGFIDDDGDGFGTGSQLQVCSGTTLPDGYADNPDDCDDTDPTVNPDADELCDGMDNNCDGQTDEGFPDTDSDGTADCLDPDDDDDGTDDGDDCAPLDDTRWQLLPGFIDDDGDGFGTGSQLQVCSGATLPDGYADNADDCDDTDPAINPDADELCDGMDNNCDGQTDEGFPDTDGDGTADCVDPDDDNDGTDDGDDCAPLDDTRWQELPGFIDDDGDDFGTGSQLQVCSGTDLPDGYADNGDDCDDTDPAVNPDATELCDGVDNDCDGQTDEGFTDTDGDGTADCVDDDDDGDGTNDADDCAPLDDTRWQELPGFIDDDDDGFGTGSQLQVCSGATLPDGYADNGDDCDDTDANVNPDADEVCNGIDDDCDTLVDDDDDDCTGQPTWYADSDGDGFGDPAVSLTQCEQPDGYVADNTDCDDADPEEFPGQTWYSDDDGDGFGDPTDSLTQCEQPTGYVADNTDCDDTDANVNPDADEVCNGIDDDCDTLVDDHDDGCTGQPTWYADADGDGFGDPAVSLTQCDQPTGYVADNTDCDDTDPDVNPDADEVCNGIDDDCDTLVDEDDDDCTGQPTWYADSDGDGFGDPAVSLTQCEQPDGYVADNADCDDTDADVNPDADEVCNGIDDDCDTLVDDDDDDCTGQPTWYADSDGDGFGDPAVSLTQCEQPDGYVADNADCDDTDPDEHPGQTWYADADGDGFGDPADSLTQCEQPDGYADNADDCDDTDDAVNPDADEVCNGIDDDCDGEIDDADDDCAPPTAHAGGPYTGIRTDTVTLDGSGSSDSDGTIATYRWLVDSVHVHHGSTPTHTLNLTAYTLGQHIVSLLVTDEDLCTDVATTTLTVLSAPPIARDDTAAVEEDSADNAIDVLDNDTDPDPGDTLSVSGVGEPDHGSVINNTTDVSYTPDRDFCGTDTFTYTVSDESGGTDSATVTVTVTCVNDPPVANDDSASTDEGTSVVIDLVANDTDIDGSIDPSTMSIVTEPTHGSLTIHADGTVTYTPDDDYVGDDSFSYTVDDDEGETSNEATITLVITAPPEYMLYLPLVAHRVGASAEPMVCLPLIVRAH